MPPRLLNRADNAIKRLKLSELPRRQREALEINVHRAVCIVDLAREHQKASPLPTEALKNRGEELRQAADVLKKEREHFPASAEASINDAIIEAERLASLCEQSTACRSERRDRAQHLAALHAWYLQMDVRELFWANECGETKGGVNVDSAYWRLWRLKRLPGSQPEGLWHELSKDLYGDKVNFEYLQNLHEALRKAGRGLQHFWEKKKRVG